MFLKHEQTEKAKRILRNKINELKTRNFFESCQELNTEILKGGNDLMSMSKELHYKGVKASVQERIKKEKELPPSLVLEPGFEKLNQLPTKLSKRQEKKNKKLEKLKTKGKNWFDMKAPEMTEEKLNDLKVIQMRNALDPTRFYKNTDIRPGVLPKYFQTGTVVESAADFYSGRVPLKKRKKTLVDELLEDAEFKKYQKRKHREVFGKSNNKYAKKIKNKL